MRSSFTGLAKCASTLGSAIGKYFSAMGMPTSLSTGWSGRGKRSRIACGLQNAFTTVAHGTPASGAEIAVDQRRSETTRSGFTWSNRRRSSSTYDESTERS